MSIYEKPTKTLMLEFAKENLKPGQVFDKALAVDWFKSHYPKLRPTTVQMHVEAMAVNNSVRKHHPTVKPGSGHDLFFKIGPGHFRLWDQSSDPHPFYRDGASSSTIEHNQNGEPSEVDETSESSQEFAFERDLRNYLAKNLASIEKGLTVYKDEDFSGVEFPVGGRFIDILAVDGNGAFVVIELKVSRGHERVVGQILRYMAWVKRHLALGKDVRGIIAGNDLSDDLKLAASLVPSLSLFEYSLSMKIRPAEPLS